MADPAFTSQRGGGGGLWHALPENVEAAGAAPRWPTHIFQANAGGHRDGGPTFVLGVYDPVKETYTNVTKSAAVDIGNGVAYGQLSHTDSPSNERRTIHVSWLVQGGPGPSPPNCDGGGQLTSFRDIRFDPRLPPFGRLVETPIEEYATLRGAQAFRETSVSVAAGAPPTTLYSATANVDTKTASTETIDAAGGATAGGVATFDGTVLDVEIDVEVPASYTTGILHFGVRCESATSCTLGAVVTLAIGADGDAGEEVSDEVAGEGASGIDAGRTVTMTVSTPEQTATTTFPTLASETSLQVRIMSDRHSVEVFVGAREVPGVYSGGRGVFSGTLFSDTTNSGDYNGGGTWWTASSEGADIDLSSSTGWAVNSIFTVDAIENTTSDETMQQPY